MAGVVKFHTKYKSHLRWLLITFLMLFITAVITPANFSNILDKGPVSIFAQEWEEGSETTFESGSQPLVGLPTWEEGSETTFESGSEPVPSQPQWESGSETTFESAPAPVYEQPFPENTAVPDTYIPPAPVYETPASPQQVYNPPVYEAPVYNPPVQSPQLSDPQPATQQAQPQIQQQPVTPVTAEDYQCEGGNKVYYRIYINISRSPERTGRVDYNNPSCTSQIFNAPRGSTGFHSDRSDRHYPALSASCFASPGSVRVGEGVTWQVLTNGGSGSFRYEWSGDSSVNGQSNSSFFVPSYNSAGHRIAQVEVKDRITDRKVSATCSLQVTALPTPTPTPTQVPTLPSNQTAFPTFAPIVIPVISQPQIQVISNSQNAQCPSGTIEKSRTVTQLVCERPTPSVTTVTASNPVQCPSGTIEKSRTSSEIICERPIQTITTTQSIVTASPATTVITQAGVTSQPVQCPSGTIEKSRTAQELICERQIAATTQQVAATPVENKQSVTVLTQDAASSIRELPKTGLPLAAIGFTALTPIGLKLKRLMGKREVAESANDIWMKRQINF